MSIIRKFYLVLVVVVLFSFIGGYAIGEENAKININTATAQELLSLKGVGAKKANSIIAYRDEKGSFASIEDIKNVKGIGDKMFEKIKDMITIDEE